jgi:hypothetical protein
MDITEIRPGAILWHKHHRTAVKVNNTYQNPYGPDGHYVECTRKPNEKPMFTHPDLLQPMKDGDPRKVIK